MKQVYTYFWWTLPSGALISVATILVALSSTIQWSNLLISPKTAWCLADFLQQHVSLRVILLREAKQVDVSNYYEKK